MELLIFTISLMLAISILTIEACRLRFVRDPFFLSLFNLLYLNCYVAAPVLMALLRGRDLGVWNWIYKHPFPDTIFLYASIISLVGYFVILSGYAAWDFPASAAKQKHRNRHRVVREDLLLSLAIVTAAVGTAALLVYCNAIGGLGNYLRYANAFRGEDPPVVTPWSFLIHIAPFTVISSYIFYGLTLQAKTWGRRLRLRLALLATSVISLLVLYHMAGRMLLGTYLLVFIVHHYLYRRHSYLRLLTSVLILGGLFIVFGRQLFQLGVAPSSVADRGRLLLNDPAEGVTLTLLEFSFPYPNLANAVNAVPVEVGYRYFRDVPQALTLLLPKRLLALQMPETVTAINIRQIGEPIPVDLMSFGYYSLGLPGILVTCLVFGLTLGLFDRLLPSGGSPVISVLRVAWLLFLSFRVMYGDPWNTLKSGFALIVCTLIVLAWSRQPRGTPH